MSTIPEDPVSGEQATDYTTAPRRWHAVEPREYGGSQDRARRVLDLAISLPLLVLLTPVLAVIAIVIKIDSPGPVMFCHERVGMNRRRRSSSRDSDRRGQNRGGRPFTFYKFRTMYADAGERFPHLYHYEYTEREKQTLPIKVLMCGQGEHGMDGDPRITRAGRWLRQTSLDELPNIFNVIRGDMHLVGPRPDIASNVRHYKPDHLQKFNVKPGVTGLAQISGRGLLSFDETNVHDCEYVATRSLLLDFKILVKTIPSLIKAHGAF